MWDKIIPLAADLFAFLKQVFSPAARKEKKLKKIDKEYHDELNKIDRAVAKGGDEINALAADVADRAAAGLCERPETGDPAK